MRGTITIKHRRDTTVSGTSGRTCLDGYNFGELTKRFRKPFDARLHAALVKTACDLLKEFQAFTTFVLSDEIVLVFPTTHPRKKGGYVLQGKVKRICSVMASSCAVRFVRHLQAADFRNDAEIGGMLKNCAASFSANCFNLAKDEDVLDYVVWRLRRNIRSKSLQKTWSLNTCHMMCVQRSEEQSRHIMRACKVPKGRHTTDQW